MATIGEALGYPFGRWRGLLYWMCIIIPIAGLLAWYGYGLRVMKSVMDGDDDEVPEFGSLWDNIVLGFYSMCIGSVTGGIMGSFNIILANSDLEIPLIVMYCLSVIYLLLLTPIMTLQLAETGSLAKALNIVRANKILFGNFGKYLVVVLKVIVVYVIWIMASIPLLSLPITLPAMVYSTSFLWGQFYYDIDDKPDY